MTVDKATRNRQNAPSRARYEAKSYRKYTIRVRHDAADGLSPDDLESAASAANQSVNAYINQAIQERIARDSSNN